MDEDSPLRVPDPSVVLPLLRPEVAAVSVGGPQGGETVVAPVDAATAVRRDDLSRTAAQVAWLAVLLSGAALVAYLVTSWPPLVSVVGVLSATSVVAAIARSRLEGARVPRLRD